MVKSRRRKSETASETSKDDEKNKKNQEEEEESGERQENEKETEEEEEKKSNEKEERAKEDAHPALGSRRTRAVHLLLIVLAVLTLVFCVYVLIFSLNRAGSSQAEENQSSKQIKSQQNQNANASVFSDATSTSITILGNEMISAGSYQEGIHYLGLNEAIISEDGTKRLWLNAVGELLLHDLRDPENPILCWRSCTANQNANRFVLGSNGVGFILRADGSKVYEFYSNQTFLAKLAENPDWKPLTVEEQRIPWQTPNCRGSLFRNCNPSSGAVPCSTRTITPGCYQSLVNGPYFLRFISTGLEIVSISSSNVWTNVGDNKKVYPALVSDPYAPIQLWFQPCPLPEGSSEVVCSPVPLSLNYAVGSCCPDT